MHPLARHLVVVPHTHWDREWYLTHEQFRYRLLQLLDGLLDLLERDPAYRHFLLDGQTIVLDDYLAVRPAARERVEKLVREGRMLIGPWTVLPDEWLVSGEALVRNLRNGIRSAERFGGAMRVGYVPDQFGHVGQLPQILRGFGLADAVLWRGVGDDVSETTFWWEAPDGSRVFTLFLPRGYGNATLLPLETGSLVARLAKEIDALAPFSPSPTLLLMNGSDHQEPQPALPAALERAARHLEGVTWEIGTLPIALRRLRAEAEGRTLAVHRGELRSGLRAPLLPGCASARMPQKQRDFRNDRLLVRYLEPLAAWLGALGGNPDRELIDFVWRIVLENHPHDSICGCSVDRVHEQMDARFQRVEELAGAHLARITRELGLRVAAAGGARAGGGAAGGTGATGGGGVVVWNPNAAGRHAVDAELELDVPGADPAPGQHLSVTLEDPSGRRVPAQVEVLAAGLVWGGTFARTLAAGILPELGREILGSFVNELGWRVEADRLVLSARLGSLPDGELDVPALRSQLGAVLAQEGIEHVAVEARRPPRVRLRFVDALPAHGLRVYRVLRGKARAPESAGLRAERSAEGGLRIENGLLRVEAAADGGVRITRLADGLVVEDALRLVSEGDRGDEYNFDPVEGAVVVERPARVKLSLARASEAEVSLRIHGRWRVPAALTPDRHGRSERLVELHASLGVRLSAGLERVDVDVVLHNTAEDHRLRLHVRLPCAPRRFEVESAFEVVERPIAPAADAFGSAHPAERPIGAVPQRTFATLIGDDLALTVANRGNAEVEAVPEPDGTSSLAVTLLRAVGWLSGTNLALRPMPAGPPFATPGAQVPGRHHAELGFFFHAPGDPERLPRAHAFAAPPLAFVGGRGEGLLPDGARLVDVDDPHVVVSAIEPAEEGGLSLRVWNASPEPREATIRVPGARRRHLERVDLLGQPDEAAPAREAPEGGLTVPLRPWEIASFRTA